MDIKIKFIVGIVFAVLQTSPAETMASETYELEVIKGNGLFTNNLYKKLSANEGNVFFSPISAHAVLSMAYQGAQGSTAQKLASALGVPDAQLTAQGYKEVMTRLNAVQNVTLLMANKVYLMEGHQLLVPFNKAVTDSFQSEVQLLDFGQNAAAANTINSWVEQKTNSKIKDLIQASDLDALTRLVLVNAIYFKGNWLHKFDPERTQTEKFYINDVDSVDVQMMHVKKKFSYALNAELDAQILELLYTNTDLSMIIILPNQRNGIKQLEEKLAGVNISDITKDLWKVDVNVALPKFKLEQTIDMKDVLTELGLGEIFNEDKANFRGMIELKPNENLYVSKVVQKAFIEVNEEGAEAAAATVVGMAAGATSVRIPFPSIDFIVDHPFIGLVKTAGDNVILFLGKVAFIDY